MGFDPLVNQRLLPPTFPRYTKIKSREEALDYFDALIQRLKIVTKISSYTAFHGALVRVQRLKALVAAKWNNAFAGLFH